MSWHILDPNVKTLEVETVTNVNENLDYLADEIEETLTHVNARFDTPIASVVDVLESVEDNITILNDEVPSAFYVEPWEHSSHFTREDYERWVIILNDLYDIIINGKAGWGYLRLSDGYPTIDGKKILMRGKQNG